MQQLRKNEQMGLRPGRYQQPKQNRKKQRKSGGTENFVKETVGNQLKNEITSIKSAVESNLNDLGDIVTKEVKTKTEPPTNDHTSSVRVRGILEYPS